MQPLRTVAALLQGGWARIRGLMRATLPPRRPFVAPTAALRAHLDRFWSCRGAGDETLPTLLPGTGAELVISLGAPLGVFQDGALRPLPTVFAFCLRQGCCELRAAGPVDLLCVRFRGNALRHFSPLRMEELHDQFTPGAELLGPAVDDLVAELRREPSLPARTARLAVFLEHQLSRFLRADAGEDRLAQALYYADPVLPVRDLAASLGLSVRQLERSVARTSGLSPKRFRRIARLHHAMRDLHLRGTTDYLDSALAHGYHDQAHFIHECRDLVGRTPRQILTPPQLTSHFYNTSLRR